MIKRINVVMNIHFKIFYFRHWKDLADLNIKKYVPKWKIERLVMKLLVCKTLKVF